MFNNITDAINWIESIKRFGDKLDLSRMELACTILGHPEKKLKVIHIAGTNGKGSTVAYLKHILLEQGYSVGTFTSPYIVRFNERITFNYNDISDDELITYINKVNSLYNEVLNQFKEVITFFELITLISFLYFRDLNPDYVIYEVGLGGRLDATNIVEPIIGAITSISFDHMGVLGDTLELIALEKLGIVKENMPLVTAIDQEELIPIFEYYTKNKHSDLTILDRNSISNVEYSKYTNFKYKDIEYIISMLGNHQVSNAALAIEVIHQLENRKLVKVDLPNLKAGLLNMYWPGRLEQFGNVYLDGAHNVGGAKALRDTIQSLFKGKYIKILFTSMADKEYFDVIRILDPVVDESYFTDFDYPRCESAEELYNICASSISPNHSKKFILKDSVQALKTLQKDLKKNEILLVTGSLYFISFIRKEL